MPNTYRMLNKAYLATAKVSCVISATRTKIAHGIWLLKNVVPVCSNGLDDSFHANDLSPQDCRILELLRLKQVRNQQAQELAHQRHIEWQQEIKDIQESYRY